MGAHGADKLLKDVQTYHDMYHEIVTQKMHQITPPRNGGEVRGEAVQKSAVLRVPQTKALGSRIQQQQPKSNNAASVPDGQQQTTNR
jgi:hypothetical protein